MHSHRMQTGKWLALALCAAVVSGCASVTNPNTAPPAQIFPEPVPSSPLPPQPEPASVSAPEPAIVTAPEPSSQVRSYELQDWAALPDWNNDNLAEALPAFLLSCNALKAAEEWTSACAAAAQVRKADPMAARQFFESTFVPWLVHNADGGTDGLVTGYYEPLLHGSRMFGRSYRYPVYGVPPDLLVIDLAESNPDLKGIRLRGRMQDKKVVPYYTRSEIERGLASLRGREILWVDDPVELFFLHVQGSGRVRLPGGETVRVGFAEHNGHLYKSIGRILVERGELAADKASMQGIKQWAAKNPNKLAPLLQQNPAYVFFRELPDSLLGPTGALGVPLTPGRSIAVDAMTTPLGAPVFLSTTSPLSSRLLNRLVVAQDTGTAIKGAVRADFFWGFGDDAGQSAGRMRQSGRMWILYPRGFQPKPP
ncbi:MAG: MltA domain-containing protein [Betaproteobacteria bacterium]|nr:MltA domain-containing protein [Betaproteobacteria bacterium]